MAGVNPEIPGLPSAQSQLMAAAAAMQGASALSYLGLGNPSIPGGMLSNAFKKCNVHIVSFTVFKSVYLIIKKRITNKLFST